MWLNVVRGMRAHAHGDGLEIIGSHHDRKRGEYHCHRGELAGRTFASKVEAEKTLAGGAPIRSKTSPSAVAYDRDLYGVWIDTDGDCQNTRHKVLIAEGTVPVTMRKAARSSPSGGRTPTPDGCSRIPGISTSITSSRWWKCIAVGSTHGRQRNGSDALTTFKPQYAYRDVGVGESIRRSQSTPAHWL